MTKWLITTILELGNDELDTEEHIKSMVRYGIKTALGDPFKGVPNPKFDLLVVTKLKEIRNIIRYKKVK